MHLFKKTKDFPFLAQQRFRCRVPLLNLRVSNRTVSKADSSRCTMMTQHEPTTYHLRFEQTADSSVRNAENRSSVARFSIAMFLLICVGVAVNMRIYAQTEDSTQVWCWLSMLFIGVIIGQGFYGHRSKAATLAFSFWLFSWLFLHVSVWLLDRLM